MYFVLLCFLNSTVIPLASNEYNVKSDVLIKADVVLKFKPSLQGHFFFSELVLGFKSAKVLAMFQSNFQIRIF